MNNIIIDNDISWFVYKNTNWNKRLDKYCSYHVFSNERWDFGGHQCSRKPKIKINDLGFCKFHAKKVLKKYDQLDLLNDLG